MHMKKRSVGRPRLKLAEKKQVISFRLSPKVVAYLRKKKKLAADLVEQQVLKLMSEEISSEKN